jgi:hypothetical protein
MVGNIETDGLFRAYPRIIWPNGSLKCEISLRMPRLVAAAAPEASSISEKEAFCPL